MIAMLAPDTVAVFVIATGIRQRCAKAMMREWEQNSLWK